MTLPKWATTVTTFSKILALIIFITFPILGFLFGIKYQLIKSTQTHVATQEEMNKQPNSSNKKTYDRFALIQLKNFKEDILPKLASFSAEIKNETVRSVQNTTDGSWLVETMIESTNYKPDLNETKSTVEYRNEYLVNGNEWVKLTSEPISCYIEKSKIVKHDLNIRIDTPLKEDILLLFGACNGGNYFVSAYKYLSGEKIRFTDPKGLITSDMPDYLKQKIINSEGNILGSSTLETYGREPVFVVDYIQTDSHEPPQGIDKANPSQGLGVFSVRTGELMDLVIYNSF